MMIERFTQTNVETGIRQTELSVTTELVQSALAEIQERHSDKAYHCLDHTLDVMRRATAFLDIVRSVHPELVSARDYDLVQLAAAYHDIEQDFHVVAGKRFRFAPQNEYKSILRAIEAMRTAYTPEGQQVYSDTELNNVAQAIQHTIPSWDSANITVYQPMLTENSSLISRALAYADIGTAAIDGPTAAVADSNNLFIEDNVALVEQIATGVLSSEEQDAVRSRILSWTRLQKAFITGRQNRLEAELAGLPEDLKEALKDKLFSHFDDSLVAIDVLLEEREGMSFEELIKSVGLLG